jgi:Fur family ferric uptake transcriptional regulator|tara:strand:- start:463 stop:900 length:438 start_codon:yes stop_codon:yes gene_type:complete
MTSYIKKSENLLSSKKISITNPRIVLLSLLIKEERPLTVEQILALTQGELAQSTLYRVVNDLKTFGLITEFTTPDNTIVVEVSSGEKNHHHHIFCKNCGKITDVSLSNKLESNLAKEVSEIQKYLNIDISEHSLELYGLCSNCKI